MSRGLTRCSNPRAQPDIAQLRAEDFRGAGEEGKAYIIRVYAEAMQRLLDRCLIHIGKFGPRSRPKRTTTKQGGVGREFALSVADMSQLNGAPRF